MYSKRKFKLSASFARVMALYLSIGLPPQHTHAKYDIKTVVKQNCAMSTVNHFNYTQRQRWKLIQKKKKLKIAKKFAAKLGEK